jgi:formate hydrogenlyase subunit 4
MMTLGLIILTILLAPLAGGLIMGVDRKITARLQGRVGLPLLQPFIDMLKLLGKESIAVTAEQLVYVTLHLGLIVAALVLFVLDGDLLLILFVLTFGIVSLILGAMAVNSPYSRIGAHRELLAMLAYEPVLVAMALGIYLITGSFRLDGVLAYPGMLIGDLPLIFLSLLFVLTIKLKKSPFDFATSHHGHQEIVKGITTEYSGPTLAIVELAHWYETVLLLLVVALFFANNLIMAVTVTAVCYVAEIVLDNVTARLTWQAMLRYAWTFGLMLIVINLVWVYYAVRVL